MEGVNATNLALRIMGEHILDRAAQTLETRFRERLPPGDREGLALQGRLADLMILEILTPEQRVRYLQMVGAEDARK